MKTTAMKTVMGFFVACLAFSALADDASISRVTVRQRWPWSRLVDIDYMLTADPTQSVDIAVTAYNGSEQLAIPASALSGDLYGVGEGAHRIVFDPTKTAYTNSEVLTKFHVSLTPTPIPLYMVVDLTKAVGAAGQIEYIYPGDARLETYGRFTNIWFAVTNDSVYATDKLVLRRIPAGTFMMGEAANPDSMRLVTLTRDFYAGIFEVTAAQWAKIMNGSTTITSPARNVTYNTIRGATNDLPNIDWPNTGSVVAPASFIGRLRDKTGFDNFDLPTEAEWEYLCRAGTTSYYNDGISVSANTNILNELGWWGKNAAGKVRSCGQKQPNNWGLYDTHGNVWELCRDWYMDPLGTEEVTDTPGPLSGSNRIMRGGGANDFDASVLRSANRGSRLPTSASDYTGFRLVLTLP